MLNVGFLANSENIEPPATSESRWRALLDRWTSVCNKICLVCVLRSAFPPCTGQICDHFRNWLYVRGECAYRYSQKLELLILTGSSFLKKIL
jgi:hypothetical protein